MNPVHGSAERRPTNDLASNKLVGRDSVEPVRNDVSAWNFATPDTSEIARRRLLSIRGEPLFFAHWDNAIFIHYETDPQELQRCIPYQLDLYDGHAFVSLVAFTMRGMRPRFGGRIGELLLKPIATHNFLNVRTYVRHKGEPGIYFMSEWLSNRIAAWLGPLTFGLPYRFGRIDYQTDHEHSMSMSGGGGCRQRRDRSVIAPSSGEMISMSARPDRSTNFYSSVTPLSRKSGSAVVSFASGTNHGSKFPRRSKSRLMI